MPKISKTLAIAIVSAGAIVVHLVLRFGLGGDEWTARLPLLVGLLFGGVPLIVELVEKAFHRDFGSDFLAGISIVTAVLLGEHLAGTIVVLMLSGGEELERIALSGASSVLDALARRLPAVAHRREGAGVRDVDVSEVAAGDELVIHPHEVCPVDGEVVDGRGVMDESYLTGEPFKITKTRGSAVISGAINGETVLTIRATRPAGESRYAKIMEVFRDSEANRPRIRRLGDRLGAVYTPLAVAVAVLAWAASGDPVRFLAVLVIATPCPLLIAIPVAILGTISRCAQRAIIIKSPAALEKIAECRVAILDKTGTLTHGEPTLTEVVTAEGFNRDDVLSLAAGLERYSKHPLAGAVLAAASRAGLYVGEPTEISESPGQGLRGVVGGRRARIANRDRLRREGVAGVEQLPPIAPGLECVVEVDGRYAATFRFRDAPRRESRSFVKHLGPRHNFRRVMIVSGDREAEVRDLAAEVGISEVVAQASPEEKLEIVRRETANADTLFVGDGVNDAPAMMAATVGVAMGRNSDVTAEAADVVILDNSLTRVDEFIHISERMRRIALQSAVGGMALSVVGMLVAAVGWMSPVEGAIGQEVVDVAAVFNALRASLPPRVRHDDL